MVSLRGTLKALLRLLFVPATEHTLLCMFLNIWRQIFVLTVIYEHIIMNNNCQKHDFSMESSLLRCDEPFHFCSKDTH